VTSYPQLDEIAMQILSSLGCQILHLVSNKLVLGSSAYLISLTLKKKISNLIYKIDPINFKEPSCEFIDYNFLKSSKRDPLFIEEISQ
jgi:hypothetical protein